jgi:hypothetical protein
VVDEWNMSRKHFVKCYWQGKTEVLGIKPVPVVLCWPQISDWLEWDFTNVCTAKSLRFSMTFYVLTRTFSVSHISLNDWIITLREVSTLQQKMSEQAFSEFVGDYLHPVIKTIIIYVNMVRSVATTWCTELSNRSFHDRHFQIGYGKQWWQAFLFSLFPSQNLFSNQNKLMLRIDNPASSRGPGLASAWVRTVNFNIIYMCL